MAKGEINRRAAGRQVSTGQKPKAGGIQNGKGRKLQMVRHNRQSGTGQVEVDYVRLYSRRLMTRAGVFGRISWKRRTITE